MEILYKKDSFGKIIQWSAEARQGQAGVNISLYSGELEGKLVETVRPNIQGKNIGKANETSPLTQAEKDVESLYNRKRRYGYKSLFDLKYFESINEAFGDNNQNQNIREFLLKNLNFNTRDADDNLKPMKCQQYYRSKKNHKEGKKTVDGWIDPYGKMWTDRKYFYLLNPHEPKETGALIIKFPCLIQPKINGVRATVSLDENNNVQILSKEGLKYNLPHIEEVFKSVIPIFNFHDNGVDKDIIYDGELYIYGESLQVISSAVKKENLNTPRIKFLCFDLMMDTYNNLYRFQLLKQLLEFTTQRFEYPIEVVRTFISHNDEQVQKRTDDYILAGYEGSILRDPKALYGFGKRPMTITKLKRVIDNEYLIIDIVPQDKQPDLGLYVCTTKDGKEFKVTPSGDNDFKETLLYLKHAYIGKKLTCTFYEYTEDGLPFHIISNIVRDYE